MVTHRGTQTINTDRLLLRKLEVADANDMFKNWATDSEVTKFLSWKPHDNVEETKEIIKQWTLEYENDDNYNWAIVLKDVGEVIGEISLVRMDEKHYSCEVGYCMSRKYWNMGIMTEALKAVIDYLFSEVGFNRIVALHDTKNGASGKVMGKSGMKYEGTLRQASFSEKRGFYDLAIYAILKDEWNSESRSYNRESSMNIKENIDMYTKNEIIEIAKAQLALDYSCEVSDFEKEVNTIVENKLVEGRRIYDNDGCALKILCFGNKAIISTIASLMPWFQEKLINEDAAWLFEYPKLRVMDKKLQQIDHEIADIHHYYLPNPDVKEIDKPSYNIKWHEQEDILQFDGDERFGEAFAFDKNHPDMLAVSAWDGDEIIGMAGASADSKTMWQIGIDVLPGNRGKGIGTTLVKLLKNEILKRGKVPFYGTVESHFHSQNIAINSGFFPAWAELYSRSNSKEC